MDTTNAEPNHNSDEETPKILTAKVIGLDESEENLIFETTTQRFIVPVDTQLRRLVRQARSTRPATATVTPEPAEPASAQAALTPRVIQARIRAGESPEDIAAATGGDVTAIRRYESPIIAERDYVISQAQAAPIAPDPQAPLLGEVTIDRLAARGVTADEIEWSAHRLPGAPWTVELHFVAGERERSASWSFDPRNRIVSALDDESRWLTEPEDPRDEPIPARLRPVRDWVYDVDSDGGVINGSTTPPVPAPEQAADEMMARQQDLLDELSSRRGRRQPLLGEDEEDPFDLLGDVPAAHPPASRPDEALDAEILQLPEPEPKQDEAAQIAAEIGDIPAIDPATSGDGAQSSAPDTPAEEEKPRPSRRSARRASVPSWDEIVFGARTD